jgi:hypothetical protein
VRYTAHCSVSWFQNQAKKLTVQGGESTLCVGDVVYRLSVIIHQGQMYMQYGGMLTAVKFAR